MQDKRIHIDEKFISHAWGEMHKQLDQEMPVRKERRRGLGWWWMFGLLLLTAGVGFAAFGNMGTETTAKPSQTDSNGKNYLPEAQPQVAAPAAPGADILKQKTPTTNDVLRSKKGQNELLQTRKPLLPKRVKPIERQLIALNDEGNVAPQKMNKSLPVAPLVEVGTALQQSLETEFQKAETPGKLGDLEMQDLAFTKAIPTVASQNLGTGKWNLAIEGNVMHALKTPTNGSSALLTVSKSLNSRGVGVNLGVGYTFIQQPLGVVLYGSYQPSSGRLEEQVVYYGNGFSADARISSAVSADVRTNRTQALNLHYLTVPVRLTHSVGNRIILKAGVEGGVLLAAKSDFTEGGFLGYINSKKSNDADESIGFEDNSNGIKLANFDMAAIGGIDVRLSHHLSVGTHYRFGLIDLMPLNARKEYNRLIQLGFTYHLNNRR